MDSEIRQRLGWVKLYAQTGNAGLVCRRWGISRPTLRKWWRRYQAEGEAGLRSRSRRPKHSPNRKVTAEHEGWVLKLRHERLLGARRIQHEVQRQYGFHLSTASLHKILKRHQVAPPRKRRSPRYERQVPGDRVQLDTIKIAKGKYQYTAIDDGTRYQIARLYPPRTAANTLDFLQYVFEALPFPIQRVPTDRGTEFTAYDVRVTLTQWGVKWRPNRARQPHLNGKVERVQKTDLDAFSATVDLRQPIEALNQQLEHYQDYYNWERVHGSTGVTPGQRYYERSRLIPFFGLEWFLDEAKRRKRLGD